MKKTRTFKSLIATACILALLFLSGCGAKQSSGAAIDHNARKVGCDS